MKAPGLVLLVCLLAACGATTPTPTSTGPAPPGSHPVTGPSSTVGHHLSPGTTTPTTHTDGTGEATVSPYTWKRMTDVALGLGLGPVASSTLASLVSPATAGGSWQIAGTLATGGSTTATVWRSPDAVTWSSAALPDGGPHSQARGATGWGSRTVVVGSTGVGLAQHAAVWIAETPGAAFTPVPDTGAFDVPAGTTAAPTATGAEPSGSSGGPAAPLVAGAVMSSVTSGALGLFAAGSVAGRFALWYSSNGIVWARLSKAEQVISASPGAVVRRMLETPAGAFAVGSVRHRSATDAALWSSSDGTHWGEVTNSASFSGSGEHVMTALASFGTNLVAVGGARATTSWSPAAWISPNGFTWGPPSESFPEVTGPQADPDGTVMADVAVSPDGQHLVAVGGSATEQRLWTSTDGISWTETPLPAGAAADPGWAAGEVGTDGTTTVVVDPDPGQPRVLVDRPAGWLEVSADPAVFGSPQPLVSPKRLIEHAGQLLLAVTIKTPAQTLGAEQTSSAILSSDDGRTWSLAASAGTFANETVDDLTVTAAGLLAVGQTSTTSTGAPIRSRALSWSSPDGVTWTPLVEPPVAGGTGAAAGGTGSAAGGGTRAPGVQAEAVAVDRFGVLVAAAVPAGPAVAWRSVDGAVSGPGTTLDRSPAADAEAPMGACSDHTGAVVVGAAPDDVGGTRGTIWFSADDGRTQRAAVMPAPPPSSGERVTGCGAIGSAMVAWGASATTSGTPDAAVWTGLPGQASSWTLQSSDAFAAGDGSAGITDLASDGGGWLAVTGSSTVPWTQDQLGGLGVWRSVDRAKTWQRVDTSAAPWASSYGTSAAQVVFLGTDPVIAGQVDGRLAVWKGLPSPAASATSSSG